ncbi:Hypothetical predicted protein [Pelobates cultripes]|uniref:Pyrin domain-containing protein n=1 Tax=Pelobates cultripes TaxID=61616 RepID=A0AAD1SS25_PELCU|nr:Hypothetical predicted protein [Pelobates cultripes]
MCFTVRDVLVRNLEELGERNFKRFRNKLNEFPVIEPYRSIPKARLEKADEDDVADLILAAYSKPYGVTVTLEVLRQIDQNRIAEKLEQDLETASNYKKPSNRDKPAGMMGTQRPDTVNNYGILKTAPNPAVNNYGIFKMAPNPAVNNYGMAAKAPQTAVNNYGILEIVPNPAGTMGRTLADTTDG